MGKCEKLEKDLRGASKAEGVDSCVDETIAPRSKAFLMQRALRP